MIHLDTDSDDPAPAEYAALIRDEVSKWGKVVKESGAKID